MHVRRILTGPGASSFLPFAMSQIKRLRRLHGDRFWRRWYLPGYTIEVQQTPNVATIRITAQASFYLEFQTTAFPIGTYSSGLFGTLPKAATVSVVPNNKGDVDAVLLDGARVQNTGTSAPLHRPQQIQLVDEKSSYPLKESGVYDHVMFDSWAPGNPHTGIGIGMYHPAYSPWNTEIHRVGPNSVRDTHYDVPYMDATGKNAVRVATLRNDTVDWPRAAIFRHVVDGDRSRDFAIYVDAFDQVSAFPLSEITTQTVDGDGQPLQNVDDEYVQTSRVTFPDWVYAKTERFLDYLADHPGDGGLDVFPEYDWQLHPDGTKMCAVVYAREEALFDSTFYDAKNHALSSGIGYTFFTPTATNWGVTNQFLMGTIPQQGPLSIDTTRYLCATGLLETAINISLTGDDPEDFTLSLVTTVKRSPYDDAACTLLAGYAFQDVPQEGSTTVKDAARGDLCVLDVEVYGRANDGETPDLNGNFMADTASFLSLKNFTASKEIRAFNAENDKKAVSAVVTAGLNRIVAHDMRTLSFAIMHVWDQHQYKSAPDAEYVDGAPPGETDAPEFVSYGHKMIGHFGVAIYTLNRHRHTFYPESIDDAVKTKIDAMIASNGRAAMTAAFGDIDLLPVNDLRDWSDDTMSVVRHYWDTINNLPDATDPPDGPPTTDVNFHMFLPQFGMSYIDTTGSVRSPTFEEANWFFEVMSQGRQYAVPWPMLRLSNPMPGWYLYMDQLMHRFQQSPWTAFFTHPNGSWAFYSADLIYNKGGMGYEYDGSSTTQAVELDADNFEHCIFDEIYVGGKSNMVLSFLGSYNDAVAAGVTDSTTTIDLSDLRATFTDEMTDEDPTNPDIINGSLHLNWGGFQAQIIDPTYFDGDSKTVTDLFTFNWDPRNGGYLFRPCMSQLWLNEALTTTVEPDSDATTKHPTFSSVVMIDG